MLYSCWFYELIGVLGQLAALAIVQRYIPFFTMPDMLNPEWHYLIFTLYSIFKPNHHR
jgi:hypothetical protein